MSNPKIILLAGEGSSTNILYHALKKEYDIASIILEEPVGKLHMLKKRARRLGTWKVAGQVLFRIIVVTVLDLFSARRKKEILYLSGLEDSPLPPQKINRVTSVNDDRCIELLRSLNPGLVLVNGTRIISERILKAVPCQFINMHAGITPKYRGVHGAYWALVNDDRANCGVTIHLVDPGIDTGAVIAQQNIAVGRNDNFVTYPYLQMATGIPLMKKAIENIVKEDFICTRVTTESRLWSHPTLTEYLFYRITQGNK